MRFETVPTPTAEGAILVHSLKPHGRKLKKGRVLTPEDIAELEAAGITEITIARLEQGDIGEDIAAAKIATALHGEGTRMGAATTGRANLYAECDGVLVVDPHIIDNANLIDDALTIATLAPYTVVAKGDMVATVKIIPYAAPEHAVDMVADLSARAPLRVAAFRPLRAALITTEITRQKDSVIEKTRSAMAARLKPLGGNLVFEKTCAHDSAAVTRALQEAEAAADIFFVLGASAISDRRDVVPSAVVAAGGKLIHFGMPVDPGNLLLLAEMQGKPVIGLPGCARSPKTNGLDFVLQRLFAGLDVTREDIMRMGVGGLLAEISERPQPRRATDIVMVKSPPRVARVAGIVLAAGNSSRMGCNKLLADIGGVTLLRRTVEAAAMSSLSPLIAVTGNDQQGTEATLKGLDVQFVHNPDYADGLSTSLRTGLTALPDHVDAALVLLGDMPEIPTSLIERMIAAFAATDGHAICVATASGKRGNPVLWARRYFSEMEKVTGDTGAKHLIAAHEDSVLEIDAGEYALRDIDTPEALTALRARTKQAAD